jgi:hypothetical protein
MKWLEHTGSLEGHNCYYNVIQEDEIQVDQESGRKNNLGCLGTVIGPNSR